jgi:hypothetical protein
MPVLLIMNIILALNIKPLDNGELFAFGGGCRLQLEGS